MDTIIEARLNTFLREYTQMNIGGILMNCPYWMNKLADGQVIVRGFLNGKGSAKDIRDKLSQIVENTRGKRMLSVNQIKKIARRERIGIDCSGFAYRILDFLIKQKSSNIRSLDTLFSGGINKTSAATLTSGKYSSLINYIKDIQVGDLIRMRGGKHVLVVVGITNKEIMYAHCARVTQVEGAHLGTIKIKDGNTNLDDQKWMEKTSKGEDYGFKYFNKAKGDGVYRLKIFS